MPKVIEKVLRAGEGRLLKKLQAIAEQVNVLEEDFEKLTDDELLGETEQFRKRLKEGETLDDLLPEAYAAVREASRRTIGKRHFDVQIMGGAALHMGNVAEMRTGEGKTLVATLPSYLNALEGKGVHVVTVNDYLAEYQAELMGRVHRALGLETGVILASMTPDERREQYLKDITYGTNNEFGFDYLRDNMAWSHAELVQREHHFCIVDEVDSILIDEARTPLIISGPADEATRWYVEFARIVEQLTRASEKDPNNPDAPRDGDYEVDEKKKTVGILESGIETVEDLLGIENLYEAENTPLIGYLNNAIKAKELFKNDKDYVAIEGEILIVDEHTGRMLAGRRYNEGIHQAIEAKEGVDIKNENQTMATVTLQNYFRMYKKISGMTGTAQTEAAELNQIYKLGVVTIPTNKPMVRADQSDLIYRTEEAKFGAVVADIVARHKEGQPVLVGTTSVEKSEYLSEQLRRRKVPHEVLNAKQHEREASIVAQAGRKGAVTVATNMAGRGTDIMLGGNPEFIAVAALKKKGLDPAETPEEYEAAWDEALAKAEKAVKSHHDEVLELGGLYVLGTERHESRRIDNQLRGRAGRQGDPGESRFYHSLQDDLLRLFNNKMVERFMSTSDGEDEIPIESKLVSRSIMSAQGQVESQNFEQRKNVLKYDDVLNRQRETIYRDRRRVLDGEDLEMQMRHFVNDVVDAYVDGATAEGFADDWDLDTLWSALKDLYPVSITLAEVEEEVGGRSGLTTELLGQELRSDAQHAYDGRENQLGDRIIREVERRVVLSVLDHKWREHLYEMDYLKDGIHLRQFAQRDPLVEYQREGYEIFAAMNDGIKEESVQHIFHVEVDPEELEASLPKQSEEKLTLTAPDETGRAEAHTVDNQGRLEEADAALPRAQRRAKNKQEKKAAGAARGGSSASKGSAKRSS